MAALAGGLASVEVASAAEPLPACTELSPAGTLLVTDQCTDPAFTAPYTDVDEWRMITDSSTGRSVRVRYVHGGFEGTNTRFAFYFPPAERYRGRFFEGTYPTIGTEGASPDDVVFAVRNGAYVVSTNNDGGVAASPTLGGYRANASSAKYSRVVARQVYGESIPRPRGYLYGGSGGAYQTLGGAESTSGIWDGTVPMVPGVPNAIPSFQGVRVWALRELGDVLPQIADAMEPGGSGNPYAGLTARQRDVLREVSTMGIPLRGWWQHATIGGGSFTAVTGAVRILDPTYVADFWTKPGYEGTDPTETAAAARIQHDTTIASVTGPTSLAVSAAPPDGDLLGADLVVTSGAAAGRSLPIASIDGTTITLAAPATGLAVGDAVRVDNSWTVALEYYARHQVPTPDQYGWNQYRDAAGNPIPPQRGLLTGPFLARTSGAAATGRFNGKMIMLASTMDMEAYPWSADWYADRARADKGSALDASYRLWFMDNADHTPPRGTYANTHLVSYEGELEQALLYLDEWVRRGSPPPASTRYTVDDQSQITLPDSSRRGGVQPVVDLAVRKTGWSWWSGHGHGHGHGRGAGDRVDVRAGQPVTLSATAEAPRGAGKIVKVEWDFEGTGDFPVTARTGRPDRTERVSAVHRYTEPGTYFPVVRVTAERRGDTRTTDGLVANLARVRVVVR